MKYIIIPIVTSVGVIFLYCIWAVLLVLVFIWTLSSRESMKELGFPESPVQLYKQLRDEI